MSFYSLARNAGEGRGEGWSLCPLTLTLSPHKNVVEREYYSELCD
jgi:hypothetical protein